MLDIGTGCSSALGCNRGFATEGNVSGECLLVRVIVEEIKEPPKVDNPGGPRNPIFGDGTLPYRSIDCLKH